MTPPWITHMYIKLLFPWMYTLHISNGKCVFAKSWDCSATWETILEQLPQLCVAVIVWICQLAFGFYTYISEFQCMKALWYISSCVTSDLFITNSYTYCFPFHFRVFLYYTESGTWCFLTAYYVTNAVIMMVVVMVMVLWFQLWCLFAGVHVLWKSVWCMYSMQSC